MLKKLFKIKKFPKRNYNTNYENEVDIDHKIEKYLSKLEQDKELEDFNLNSLANMEFFLNRESKFEQLNQIYDVSLSSSKLTNEEKAEIFFSKSSICVEQGNIPQAELYFKQGNSFLEKSTSKKKELLLTYAKGILEQDHLKALEHLKNAFSLTKEQDPLAMKVLTRVWRLSSTIFEMVASSESLTKDQKKELGQNAINILESFRDDTVVINEYNYFIYATFLLKINDRTFEKYFKKAEQLSKENNEIHFASLNYLLSYYVSVKNEQEKKVYLDKIMQLQLNEKQQTQLDSLLIIIYIENRQVEKARETLEKLLSKQQPPDSLYRLLSIKISLLLLEKDTDSAKFTFKKIKSIPEVQRTPNIGAYLQSTICKIDLFDEFKSNQQVVKHLSEILFEENSRNFELAFNHGSEALAYIPNTFSKFKLLYLMSQYMVNTPKDFDHLLKVQNFLEKEIEQKEFSENQMTLVGDIYYRISNYYFNQKKIEESLKVLETYLTYLKEGYDDYLKALNNIAFASVELKNYPRAVECLQKILSKSTDPDSKIDNLMNLGVVYSHFDITKAFEHFDQAKKVAADNNLPDLVKGIESYVEQNFKKK